MSTIRKILAVLEQIEANTRDVAMTNRALVEMFSDETRATRAAVLASAAREQSVVG